MINSVSADFEHEIPNGSKLYFGENATLKRKLENYAAKLLSDNGFSEILTPYFSYHQHLSVAKNSLLNFSDPLNNEISLRGDSTVDVVRIVKRRLKNENLKRWFYIQPIFKYPSSEIYQIGAELINENNLSLAISLVKEIFANFGLNPALQISNIKIPKLICKILDVPISVFEKGQIEILFEKNIDWLNKIAKATSFNDISNLKNIVPGELIKPLQEIENLKIDYENVSVSLLYYSKMRYYDELFFRFLDEKFIFCSGGNYELDGTNSSGFAIIVDTLIEKLCKKD